LSRVQVGLRAERSLRRILLAFLFIAAAGLLAACNALTTGQEDAGPDVFDKVRSMDLLPRYPQPMPSTDQSAGDRARPQIYTGAVVPVMAAAHPRVAGSGGGYDLNFENTPVTTVAKVVLGDILGVGYTIDPRVQGTVTLASGRPVAKSDVLYVLEAALRLSNVVIERDPAGYRLVPLGEAVGSGHVDKVATAEPGYGISVVPLQYVSAQTLMKLLDSFATKPGTVRADPGRNMVLIQGTGVERRATIQTVLSFDTDWMRGQSVGIYPVRNSVPEQVIADLQKILDSEDGGLSHNMVKLQAIDRMNAILAVTRKAPLLKTVSIWIGRLDKSDTASTGVKVYHVRYGEARQIARVLNNLFVGNSGNSLESPANQIAPGSGSVTASSRDRATDRLGTAAPSFGASQGFGSAKTTTRSLGEMAANIRQSADKGAAAPDASPSGPPILKGVRITADTVTNTLLIYASQENYRVIERTLRQIDRPQLQVAINATIAEVTLNNQLNYGVQFYLTSHNLGINPEIGSVANTYNNASGVNVAGVVGPVLSRAFPGFNFLVGGEAQPSVILDALHDVTTVKVLSNPSIVVLDNEPAVLQVGDEVPVSTGSATVLTTSNTVVNTIDYRNTGVILQVVPRINVNGNVVLDIQQEISNVSNTSTADTLTPTVSQRKIKSTIAVASGQTVLLAGLIGEREERSHPAIPGLENLPLVGDAFGHSATTTTRTELIIFIRPQIIRDSVDANFVAEELRSKLKGTSEALARQIPRRRRIR
jgi:general secretion pathway protein D